MTIAEYIEYEAEMKRRSMRNAQSSYPTRYDDADVNSFQHDKRMVLDYPHYSDDAKIDAYYDLSPLFPCFQPVQPHTNHGHKSPYVDIKGDMDNIAGYKSDVG
ncbi:hypothetical protein Tco_0380769 [Tanacetum coccineum]